MIWLSPWRGSSRFFTRGKNREDFVNSSCSMPSSLGSFFYLLVWSIDYEHDYWLNFTDQICLPFHQFFLERRDFNTKNGSVRILDLEIQDPIGKSYVSFPVLTLNITAFICKPEVTSFFHMMFNRSSNEIIYGLKQITVKYSIGCKYKMLWMLMELAHLH